MKRLSLIVASALLSLLTANAKVELPKIYSNGMVVQRNAPLIIHGTAEKNEAVTVSWRDQKVELIAKGGEWSVTMEAGEAGGPFAIVANDAVVSDILVGDVFLCGGQSNMELKLGPCMEKCGQSVKGYRNSNVRYFRVPKSVSFDALKFDVEKAGWEELDEENVLNWSAIAYFVGRDLQEKENIPVGLIDASYGGSTMEAWMDEWSLAEFPLAARDLKTCQAPGWYEGVLKKNSEIAENWSKELLSKPVNKKIKYMPADLTGGKWDSDIAGQAVCGKHFLRTTFKLDAAPSGEGELRLGVMADSDSTFINGKFVGATSSLYDERVYKVSAGILRKGKNVIEIHAVNRGPNRINIKSGEKYNKLFLPASVLDLENYPWEHKLAARMPAREAFTRPYTYPAGCFNAMICPLLNSRFAGVIWYQGESNLNNAGQYGRLLGTLIRSWREYLEQESLPFYVVELAAFQNSEKPGSNTPWNTVQKEQKKTCDELENTYFIKNGDLGECYDVHPKDKKSVSDRIVKSMMDVMGIYTHDPEDIVILYENDVHCAIDGYAGFAGLRNEMKEGHQFVFTVSNGDFAQGGSLGAASHGGDIIKLMNQVGYDFTTLGNHEFDYGIPRQKELMERLDAECLCCNFTNLKDGSTVYRPYSIVSAGGKKIAFIGVATPYSVTSSIPSYFKDPSTGKYIYGFHQEDLYKEIQKNVDKARAEGAEYVILLSHLGDTDEGDGSITSLAVIAATNGIDAVLDGHSHSTIQRREVKNKDGMKVILTSTGTKFKNMGRMLIHSNGSIASGLVRSSEYDKKDFEVQKMTEEIRAGYEKVAGRVVGKSAVALKCYDDEGHRMVRNQECCIGDFSADAYRSVLKTDIAIVGGGSLRDDIPAGNVTWNDVFTMFPFGDIACSCEVKGSTILDMLEFSVIVAPEEFGGFLHVSGIKFEYDESVKSPVKTDRKLAFTGIDGKRKVRNVKILDRRTGKYLPLSATKTYTMAGPSYIIKEWGNGYTMMSECKKVKESGLLDTEIIEKYIKDACKGTIDSRYSKIDGRITAVD